MKLAGILQPGIIKGYVVEAKYIKGGYIVVKTEEELQQISSTNKGLLVDGTPIYVSDTGVTYRYNQAEQQFKADNEITAPSDGKFYCKQGNNWVEIDSVFTTQEQFKETISTLVSTDDLTSLLQTSLVAGDNISITKQEDNSLKITANIPEKLIFNTKTNFPAIGEEGKLYIATDEETIYYWDVESQSYVAIKSSLLEDVQVIYGGNAFN